MVALPPLPPPTAVDTHQTAVDSQTSGQHSGQHAGGLLVTLCRDGVVLQVHVLPGREDGLGTRRLVHWCGAQVQVRDDGWCFMVVVVDVGVVLTHDLHG